MRRVMSASRRRAEDWGGAGVGVDAVEVGGNEGEAAIRIVDGGGVVKEEGAFGLVESAFLAAEDESAELEAVVDIGEVRLLPSSSVGRFRSRTGQPTRPLVDTDLKKRAAVLSAQMPEGVSKPTMPSGLTRLMARSTKSE